MGLTYWRSLYECIVESDAWKAISLYIIELNTRNMHQTKANTFPETTEYQNKIRLTPDVSWAFF